MADLVLVVPYLPPSSNHIYATSWERRTRFLKKEGQRFQNLFSQEVVPKHLVELMALDKNGIFEVEYTFYFPRDRLLNRSFGKKNGSEERYKRMDLENYLKLTSDCLSKAIGIDDSRFFTAKHVKKCADLVGGEPQLHIVLRQVSPKDFGIEIQGGTL